MSQRLERIRPSRRARALADFMLERVDIQQRVLEETIDSAERGTPKESGRTICPEGGEEVKGPLGRFPKAVQLQECPIGASGVVHTHTSMPELRQPHHSLPDMANVVLENAAVSMVVGVESLDLLLEPADEDDARQAFQDALGLQVESTKGVATAIHEGRIRDPADARERVRSRLPSLFERRQTAFPGLLERVGTLSPDLVPGSAPLVMGCPSFTMHVDDDQGHQEDHALLHGHRNVSQCCDDIRERMQDNERVIRNAAQDAKINPIPIIVSSAIGSFGADVIRSFLAGR